jgi:hypothetical protein
MKIKHLIFGITSLIFTCSANALEAKYSESPITIDGKPLESIWQTSSWHNLEHLMAGSMPVDSNDFSGRYKISWDKNKLYLFVEITDDVLIDSHPNPKDRYWDDDCLEVFIDEDLSGGNHLNSYNAFAYHIALDGNVADFGDANDNGVVLLNDHIQSRWTRDTNSPNKIYWEVAVDIYTDSFTTSNPGKPINLNERKSIGFMLAYCDNDGSDEREHFLGSHEIEPREGDRNLGYKDASVFGKLTLIK